MRKAKKILPVPRLDEPVRWMLGNLDLFGFLGPSLLYLLKKNRHVRGPSSSSTTGANDLGIDVPHMWFDFDLMYRT